MSTKELKDRLIERIKGTDDPTIIDHLYRLLELELDLIREDSYQLTPEEEAGLNEAEEDITKGKLISEDNANERIKKWIS